MRIDGDIRRKPQQDRLRHRPTSRQPRQEIELILSDVDGVLTDGSLVFNNQGIETKRFHIRDGLGIRLWQRAGRRFGMVTARSSHIVQLRAAEHQAGRSKAPTEFWEDDLSSPSPTPRSCASSCPCSSR